MQKRFPACLIALVAACITCSPALAAFEQSPLASLEQDAGEYARRYGLTLSDAMLRLRVQSASVDVTDEIAVQYADRVAGIVLEHRPTLQIIVLLTGTEPVADASASLNGLVVPIVFRTGADATRARVIAAIERTQSAVRAALPHAPAMAADPRTGELLIFVNAADAVLVRDDRLRQRFAKLTGVPVRIETLNSFSVNLAIAGGGRLVGSAPPSTRRAKCTSGFVVTDGARTALATAAHCPDAVSYVDAGNQETALPFLDQWGWRYRDVQINLAPAPLEPLFYADTAKTVTRTVATWRNRDATRVGDFVCHRGETTGYSCAEVLLTDFAPAGDLCGGPCSPTWVAVAGPDCARGDSGAPVFIGHTALGLVKSASFSSDGRCLFYTYISTDYLPPGWSLAYRKPDTMVASPIITNAGAAGED